MKEKIKMSGYTGAPELCAASVNGQPLPIRGTKAAYYIACRNFTKAREEIKRIYRQQNRRTNRYIYAFKDQTTKAFYYIAILSFTESDDIKTRLCCYKELKHHLQKNPPEVVTESGHITPTGAEKPHRETTAAAVNFNALLKVKIA